MANVMSSALVLIGWDDIRCRPIYRRHTSKAEPTTKRSTTQATTQLKCKGATSGGSSSSAILNHPPAIDKFKIECSRFESSNKTDNGNKRNANAGDDRAASKSGHCEMRETSINPALNKGICSPAANACHFPTGSMSTLVDVDQVSRDKNSTVGFNDTISSFEQDATPHAFPSNSGDFHFGRDKVNGSVKSEARSTTNAQIAVDTQNHDSITALAADVTSLKTQCDVCPSVSAVHSNGHDEFGTSHAYANKTNDVSEEQGRADSNHTKLEDHFHPNNSCLPNQVLSSPLKVPTATFIFGDTTGREVESDAWNTCKNSPMIVREYPKDERSISIDLQELQSPMLLECDRRNVESFDIDSVDISLFGDLEPEDISLRKNRRSYGQYNMPNWVSKSSTTRKSDECTAEQPQLVGWDDIKCRPIYHVFKPKSSRKKVESSPDEATSISCIDEKTKAQKSPQKKRVTKRVYASTFRKSGIFKAARHNMDLDSPSSSVARRVTMENYVEDGKANRFFVASNDQEDDSEFDFIFNLASNHSRCNQGQLFGAKENSPRSESKIESRTQPSSKSTIESARAFFSYLDSNHRINIISNEEETAEYERMARTVIRTTRRIRHCNQLRDEYDEYSKMVDATGIDPISLEEFARHWNTYFTEKGIIRDGLLDED